MNLSPTSLVVLWTVLGLFVGSFLNVCIHRYALEGETVSRPRRSRCPQCRTTLTWKENVPLLSWLLQRGRCRSCGWSIPARYPLVEAGNAALWAHAITTAGTGSFALWITWSVALSALLVTTIVDIDHWEIPDGVSIGGMIVAPLACLLVPALHAETSVALANSSGAGVDPVGSLVGGLAGMAVGGGVLWLIGWVGTKAYKLDAMGFGDVKLLAAGGGFIGPGGAVAALMVAALFASIVGVANVLRLLCFTRRRARARGRSVRWGRSAAAARIRGRYVPFGPFLALGIGIVLLHWEDVRTLWPTF